MPFRISTFDTTLVSAAHLIMGSDLVFFQFPPIIKADSKAVEYEETNAANIEPIATFKGSKPRQIDLKWTYIVTNASANGVVWSADNVASQVKKIRSFYYQTINEWVAGDTKLSIKFQAYSVVGLPGLGSGGMSFRSDGVNISHSDVVVGDAGGYYPLRTDIDMKLKLWTSGEMKEDKKKKQISMTFIEDSSKITPDWR